jgi:hypothetical protein
VARRRPVLGHDDVGHGRITEAEAARFVEAGDQPALREGGSAGEEVNTR